ncbi:MAG: RnfABCDGE type electron transport complex subunit D [Halioglobus sp.]|nr:RnfABCDGE type electron transport complex subunit D [Halioglobus sp.]
MHDRDDPFGKRHDFSALLEVESSPHLKSGAAVDNIMLNVVLALLPTAVFACYLYGLTALLSLATATVSCVAAEHILCRAARRPLDSGGLVGRHHGAPGTGSPCRRDCPCGWWRWAAWWRWRWANSCSAAWGTTPFNPALVGRAFLQAAFPGAMTHWQPATRPGPLHRAAVVGVRGAVRQPLLRWRHCRDPPGAHEVRGSSSRSGRTCCSVSRAGRWVRPARLSILLGGAWLAWRKMLNWRIPAAILATVALLSAVFHALSPQAFPGPAFMLFSGGLMLGAVFMATDMVASPITWAGAVLSGRADRHTGCRHPSLGRHARGCDVRHPDSPTPYRPTSTT